MDTRIAGWRQQIEAIGGGDRIARFAVEFLSTEHAKKAIDLGWTELELFGLHHGDLRIAAIRGDVNGLIPSLTIAATHSYTITAIEPDCAVLLTNGGATLMHRRRLPEERLAISFWEHSAFRGGR
jgi:hypothetical protein